MDSEAIVRNFHQKRGRIRDPEKIHPGSGSRIRIRNTGPNTPVLVSMSVVNPDLKFLGPYSGQTSIGDLTEIKIKKIR
jgi:hypothetical protein